MPRVSGFVSSPVTLLAIVIWRPSRIQAAPSPMTIRVWNGDQPRRSSRAGIRVRIDRFGSATLATRTSLQPPRGGAPLRDALEQVLAHADRVRHRGEGRVHRADTGEEAGVDDVQVVDFVRLAVLIENGIAGIAA